MAKKTSQITWQYNNRHPHMGIRIRAINGKEYPAQDEISVLLDTGYTGGVILPILIYKELELFRWESSLPKTFKQTDGTDLSMLESAGFIFVPKLKKSFKVKLYCSADEDCDSDEVMLGIDFINQLKLLLDGLNQQLSVVK